MEIENAKSHIAYQAESQQWKWKVVMGIADAVAALMTVSKSWALPWSIPILALTAVQSGIQPAAILHLINLDYIRNYQFTKTVTKLRKK
jgi:hypothetical protein